MLFFCILFGHKIDKFVLFKYEADRLGYVAHRYNPRNLYHRIGNFFIGTGPIWFGFLTIVILSEILLPKEVFSLSSENNDIFFKFMYGILKPAFWFNPLSYLWIYLTTSIVLHISLSKADMKGAFDGLVTLFVLIFILNLALYWHIDISNFISDTVLKICIFTLPVAAIIFFFLLVFSLILSLRKK